MPLDPETRRALLLARKNEVTEHHIYTGLAASAGEGGNGVVLRRVSQDELRRYQFWRGLTGEDVSPSRWRVRWFTLLSRVLGLSFGLRLMENGEGAAEAAYRHLARTVPAAGAVADDEDAHERQLLAMIDEERLRYVGSMVFGLNDALVELTGTLAGLTFALQKTRLIAMAGPIAGVAASLSMAASQYLSTKSEESERSPLKASLWASPSSMPWLSSSSSPTTSPWRRRCRSAAASSRWPASVSAWRRSRSSSATWCAYSLALRCKRGRAHDSGG